MIHGKQLLIWSLIQKYNKKVYFSLDRGRRRCPPSSLYYMFVVYLYIKKRNQSFFCHESLHLLRFEILKTTWTTYNHPVNHYICWGLDYLRPLGRLTTTQSTLGSITHPPPQLFKKDGKSEAACWQITNILRGHRWTPNWPKINQKKCPKWRGHRNPSGWVQKAATDIGEPWLSHG